VQHGQGGRAAGRAAQEMPAREFAFRQLLHLPLLNHDLAQPKSKL
jgi:hypothetical protein